MNRLGVVAALFVAVFTIDDALPQGARLRGPIPLSQVTPDEVPGFLRERGMGAGSVEEAAELLGVPESAVSQFLDGAVMYKDSDVRVLFPELTEAFERESVCTDESASPPLVSITYVAPAAGRNHEIDVRSLDCRDQGAGLYCSMSEWIAFFVSDRRHHFRVAPGLPGAEATDAVARFLRSVGSEGDTDVRVTAVRKRNSHYELSIGNCGCSGTVEVAVRHFLFWSWIDVVRDDKGVCF
jgi:hypothetical protein